MSITEATTTVPAGTWKAEFKPFGLKMGAQASDMKVCGGLSEAQLQKLEAIKKDLLAGKIKTLDS